MNEYLEYLKNPFIAGIVSGLFIVLFAYIDKNMNDRDFENNYYFKLFISVFIMVTALVYFASSGSSGSKRLSGGNYETVKVIKEASSNVYKGSGLDVFTDVPDF